MARQATFALFSLLEIHCYNNTLPPLVIVCVTDRRQFSGGREQFFDTLLKDLLKSSQNESC